MEFMSNRSTITVANVKVLLKAKRPEHRIYLEPA